MTKEYDFDEFDQQYFQNLVSDIADHPNWVYDEEFNGPVEEKAETAAGLKGTSEVWIDNNETDGTFHLLMPHRFEPVAAATGPMRQPLDGAQAAEPYEDSFGERIVEAYRSLTEDVDADYLEADPNPISILSMQIPLDYDQDRLNEALDEADRVSRDVQDVNDEVRAVLDQAVN